MEKGGGDVTPEIARTVGREYASTDPAAAFAWARALSADLQAEALGSVLWGWRDKAAAAQAVEQLPEGELKASAQNEMRTISQQKRR